MNKLFACILFFFTMLMSSSIGYAQSTAQPWALKLGAYVPVSNSPLSKAGAAKFMIEGEYDITDIDSGIDQPSSSDYATTGMISVGGTWESHTSLMPITIGLKTRDSASSASQKGYLGLGIGNYIFNGDRTGSQSGHANLLGGYVLAGMDIASNLFIEAKYHIVSSYAGKNLDGVQISAGVRF